MSVSEEYKDMDFLGRVINSHAFEVAGATTLFLAITYWITYTGFHIKVLMIQNMITMFAAVFALFFAFLNISLRKLKNNDVFLLDKVAFLSTIYWFCGLIFLFSNTFAEFGILAKLLPISFALVPLMMIFQLIVVGLFDLIMWVLPEKYKSVINVWIQWLLMVLFTYYCYLEYIK